MLFDAIRLAAFDPRMVSDSDEVSVIQKRIVQNIYNNPIVVCDVSGKNANVMFELGMRLAFDKPVVNGMQSAKILEGRDEDNRISIKFTPLPNVKGVESALLAYLDKTPWDYRLE